MPAQSSDLSADPLLAGVPVHEGYKVLGGVVLYEKLGAGGMGAVYRGRHLRLDIDVAVKVMAPPVGLPPDQADKHVRRFLREARTAASVKHPNLIRVYDVNSESGVHFIIMDYVDGESAAGRLKRRGRLSEEEAVEIALGAAEGLAAAHEQGIVHRDVKPDNILIDKAGDVVVADLGLAKAYAAEGQAGESPKVTETQTAVGTPHYMSPEQIVASKDVGPQSDVWSLGVTLYQLVTGQVPWSDSSVFLLADKIRNEPVPDPKTHCAGLSDAICAIITKATRKTPAERYADCGEVTRVLRGHLDSIRTSAQSALPDAEAGATRLAVAGFAPPDPETMTLIAVAAVGDSRGEKRPSEAQAATLPTRRVRSRATLVVAIVVALALLAGSGILYFLSGPRDASAYVSRGRSRARKKNWDGAFRDLDKAIKLAPNDARAYSARGDAHFEKGDWSNAIRDYDIAVEFDPNDVVASRNRPVAYHNRAVGKVWRGDLDGAIRDYDMAMQLDPDNAGISPDLARTYHRRGGVKLDMGDLDGAIRDFDMAVALEPRYATSYFNRGFAKGRKRDWNGAIADLEKSLELEPNSLDAHRNLALVYYNRGGMKLEKGDVDAAIEDYDKSIQHNPKDAQVYHNRGLARARKGDEDGAIVDFERAIKLRPDHSDTRGLLALAYSGRGLAKEGKGDEDGAIRDVEKAFQINPGDPVLKRNLARAYLYRGTARAARRDLESAIRDLDKAIQLDPNNALTYEMRGRVRQDKGDLDGAIRNFDKAIQLDPKEPKAYHIRGLTKEIKGDLAGAKRDFETARRLGYSDTE